MQAESEADLVAGLRPGVDGLIIREGDKRATFLPSVWQGIPEPERFVRALAKKAGWPAGHWSDTVRVLALHHRGVRVKRTFVVAPRRRTGCGVCSGNTISGW